MGEREDGIMEGAIEEVTCEPSGSVLGRGGDYFE